MSSRPSVVFANAILGTLLVAATLSPHVRAQQPPGSEPGGAEPLSKLKADILETSTSPGVQRGTWGVAVQSLDRHERLFSLNPDILLVPASTAKLVTVAAAAEAVGWDYRYETTVSATGPISRGVLHGDLLVVGSGDPTIGGRAGAGLFSWVAAIRAAGVRRIEGRIIGDDNAVEEPRPQLAWAWDDLGYSTGAVFGALNLAENRIFLTIAPGPAIGTPTHISVEPQATSRPIANRSLTSQRGSTTALWPEQRPGETYVTIDGTLAVGASPVTLAVSAGNPTAWFVDVLRHQLATAGIEITGRAYDVDDLESAVPTASASVLHRHRSEPLSTIVQPLLKESINLYAEAALRLNVPPGVFPTNDAALAAVTARLSSWGAPAGSHQLVDGSGLSRRDALTANTIMTVLTRVADPSGASPLLRGLPVAGVDGSLAQRMRGTAAAGNVRAKTGTMSNSRSLAGYVTSRDGERLAFVILVNNFEGTGAQATSAIDAMAVRLANFSRQP